MNLATCTCFQNDEKKDLKTTAEKPASQTNFKTAWEWKLPYLEKTIIIQPITVVILYEFSMSSLIEDSWSDLQLER